MIECTLFCAKRVTHLTQSIVTLWGKYMTVFIQQIQKWKIRMFWWFDQNHLSLVYVELIFEPKPGRL